jgi:hypothetical protein
MEQRYKAFLSYSHKDAGPARWLHRRLESYRIPRRLTGQEPGGPAVPDRLTPIFRDREELAAGHDLSEGVRAALARSDALIVLCSPDSAASIWVGREITAFRELNPGKPVFAAIVRGDPAECFPRYLREGADGTLFEPLAADLRPEGDGRRLGLLKLVAGLAGVGLDALVQRDAQRRIRRVMAVTLAAAVAVIAMAVLTAFALSARADAERQRKEAEGLVEFMLTDLRDRLKGVGRLDVLTAVNRRALDHYRQQNLATLPADSLERRARILHAMGEDDERRGNLDRALAQFREAGRTTAALLAASPDDPQTIFAHAQSEFWIGSVDYERGDFAKAKAGFERYKALADRLVAIEPANPAWLKEAGYAEGNLCSIALSAPIDAPAALKSCSAALGRMAAAARRSPDPSSLDVDIANRRAWLADAWYRNGRLDLAMVQRKRQEKLLADLVARDPRNMDLRDISVTNQMAIAGLQALSGQTAEARRRLISALALVDTMVRMDPANKQWTKRREDVQRKLSNISQPHRRT